MASVLQTISGSDAERPPMRDGDRMSQPEFHRCYEACRNGEQFELIDGVVHMAAAQRRPHSVYESHLSILVGQYGWKTPGVEMLLHPTTILDAENEPQPDIALRILTEYGGQSKVTTEEYLSGPPELVMEVAHSTVDRDLNEKLRLYRSHGVLEYIVLCIEPAEFRWFVWPDGERSVDSNGILKSVSFPGLWIDTQAVLQGQISKMELALQKGLNHPEHSGFLSSLQARRA